MADFVALNRFRFGGPHGVLGCGWAVGLADGTIRVPARRVKYSVIVVCL